MTNDELKKIDLSRITLDELKRMDNLTLRNSLIDLIRSPGSQAASGHQNHGSHTNKTEMALTDLGVDLRKTERGADLKTDLGADLKK